MAMVQIRNTNKINWDLWESFLAISEAKSIRKAAEAQGVNHATLSRQLKKLEEHIGHPLFSRSNQGLTLTDLGQTLVVYATAMSEQAQQLQFCLDHQGDDISGQLTISLGDSLMPSITTAAKQLSSEYPRLNIALCVSNDLISLDKGEADIALRITNKPPEHLVAIPLQSVAVAAFVTSTLLQEQGLSLNAPLDKIASSLNWISWQRTSDSINISGNIQQRIGAAKIKYTVASSAMMLEAVQASLGAAFMLCNFISEEQQLIEIEGSRTELPLKVWLLYHPHTRNSPKVRAAVDTIKQHFH